MFGVLNLNKPVGYSSRDVVNRVERIIRPVRAGHAGTLDPLASGVLVVCVGSATRLIEYVQRMPKEYQATFLLGKRSRSDDLETEVEELLVAPIPTRQQIEAALPRFTGVIEQRPPAYSAIKVAGKRAYRLARRGDVVELAPRSVTIHALSLESYEYPRLKLFIRCSSGTYVRSLGRDLAQELGTAAIMSELVRTGVGEFRVSDSLDLTELTAASLNRRLLPPTAALGDLPRLVLTPEQVHRIQSGGLVSKNELPRGLGSLGALAALDEGGNLVAILRLARRGLLKPAPNFSQPE
jgi:tRNA pseudouridine55 synthase